QNHDLDDESATNLHPECSFSLRLTTSSPRLGRRYRLTGLGLLGTAESSIDPDRVGHARPARLCVADVDKVHRLNQTKLDGLAVQVNCAFGVHVKHLGGAVDEHHQLAT